MPPGVWNVVTTTDPNGISAAKMARLLLAHGRHHSALGFSGTILRCNEHEAGELLELPELAAELDAGRLLVWPWVLVRTGMGKQERQ
jgi:hypothetical protein